MTRPSENEAVGLLAAAISKSMASSDHPMVNYDRQEDSIDIDVRAIVRAMREIDAAP